MTSSLFADRPIHRSGAGAHRVVSPRSSEADLELLASRGEAAPSHLGVLGVHLPAGKPAPQAKSGDARTSRAGERIEDQLARVREQTHQLFHQRDRLLRLVARPWVAALVDDEHTV